MSLAARSPAPARTLAEIRATGLVRRASEHPGEGVEHSLPVTATLRALLPQGVLRRGSTVAVTSATGMPATGMSATGMSTAGAPATGATSLLFALLAEASQAGSWCAVVGLPRLGLVAAAEAGIAVGRLALVPSPGAEWASVVAALLDGVDVVVTAAPGPVPAKLADRLTARARQRGGVLITMGGWPGADLVLEVAGGSWHGLEQGRGRLRSRELEVLAHGRGAAARARRAHLWLPAVPAADTPRDRGLGRVSGSPVTRLRPRSTGAVEYREAV